MPNDPFRRCRAMPSLGPARYLDARDQAAFDAGQAPGAVRAPVDEWTRRPTSGSARPLSGMMLSGHSASILRLSPWSTTAAK